MTNMATGASITAGMSVVSGVSTLTRMLDGILERVVAVYAQHGVSLPDRQYWTLGSSSADCEQLVVVFVQAYVGPPGDEASTPQRCEGPMSASVRVEVTRCIPTISVKGKAPTPEQIQAGSEPLVVDAYLLLHAASLLEQWDADAGFGLGVIATVDAGQPQGGFQNVTLNLTMAIP